MNKKHKKYRYNILVRVLKITLFFLLSYAAIKLGIAGGNAISDVNVNIVRNIHVESFKTTLNKSIPLIDTVYNSGNISVSVAGELQNLVGAIFQFDLDNPVTILNAQSPFLYSFYNNSYQDYLEQERKRDIANRSEENSMDDVPKDNKDGDSSPNEGNSGKIADNANSPGTTVEYKQDQSSIYFPGEDEDEKDRDRSSDNVDKTGKIAVKNESSYKVSDALINKLLNEPLKFKFEKKGPQILIYHTHTSESYIIKPEDAKKTSVPSWTQDSRYNVVRVGDELNQYLRKKFDFNVMHNGTVNDREYNESYKTARNTVNNILKGNPSIKVVIDLHRDGLDGKSKLRKAVKVNGKSAAQLMFVIGTQHANWQENFKLALKVQERLNARYPGLALPINLRKATFNQNVRYGALIVEVGGDGNTLSEATASTEYLARAFNDVLGELK